MFESWFAKGNPTANRRILRGILYVGLYVLIGKVIAAVREIVIAYKYGVSEVVDVYVFAFVIITWLPSVWAAVLNAVYVPLARRMQVSDRTGFDAELHTVVLAGAAAIVLAVAVVMPVAVPHLAAGMSPESIELLARTSVWLSPIAGLGFVVSFYFAILLSTENHSNTLTEAIPPIFVLLLVLIWSIDSSITPLVIGTLLGSLAQTLTLYYLMIRKRMQPSIGFSVQSRQWPAFKQAFGWLIVSQLIMSLIVPIDQILAARLDAGSVSVLSYSNRLLALAIGLGVTAISRAILPVLSDNTIEPMERISIAKKWFLGMCLVGLIAVAVGWYAAPYFVKLLFERGAFTSENTQTVATAVKYGLLQFPFYFSSIVIVQLFVSLGIFRFIMYSSVLGLSVKVLLGPWLAAVYGVNGILLSTVCMYALNALLLYYLLVRYRRQLVTD